MTFNFEKVELAERSRVRCKAICRTREQNSQCAPAGHKNKSMCIGITYCIAQSFLRHHESFLVYALFVDFHIHYTNKVTRHNMYHCSVHIYYMDTTVAPFPSYGPRFRKYAQRRYSVRLPTEDSSSQFTSRK